MTRTGFQAACVVCVQICLLAYSTQSPAQQGRPDFSGMWSDPPATAVDTFCFIFCSEAGIDRLDALLDDPANDARPFGELVGEARAFELDRYFRPRLSAAALTTYPLDELEDPGYVDCQPWGVARQIFAPHQLEIRQYDDRIEMRYGEWEARRTVHLDGREPPENQPSSLMGYSLGRFDGDSLVIETSHIRADRTHWRAEHSDRLRMTERYTRSEDGQHLQLVATMEDPWGLTEPIEAETAWGWAPDEQIFPYVDCERPTASGE